MYVAKVQWYTTTMYFAYFWAVHTRPCACDAVKVYNLPMALYNMH